jgi:hypothetical protein
MTSTNGLKAALVALTVLLGLACNEQELAPLSPEIHVDPMEIDFGTVTIGAPAQQTLQIQNVGGGTLTVDSVTLRDGTGPFSVEDFADTLAPDGVVELTVSLDPTQLGPAEDVIEILSDDPDEEIVEVPVRVLDVVEGPVPAIAWSPSSLTWGAVPSGGEVSMLVTITSVGTGDLEVSDVSLDGATSVEFTLLSHPAPITMPPSTSDVIEVLYAPQDETPDTGTLLISCNDPDIPLVEIPLSGELLPAPDIELVPTQLLFGQVEIGQSVTMDAEIWSLGDATLELGTLLLDAGPEFTLDVDASGAVLLTGEYTTVTVTYTPTDTSPDNGQIEIPSNDPDENPAYLTLAGQHEPIPDIDVTPLTIDFGLVDVGVPTTDTVTVANVGTGDLVVDLPILTGSTDFSMDAAQFPTVIAAGSFELIMVTYTPTDFSADTGEITITSDDPDEPTVPVELLGEPMPAPDIDLDPTSLTYGQVAVGSSLTLSSTISNVGTADLELGTLSVVGTTEFTITVDPSGGTLAPGNATEVFVQYAPVDTGSDSAWVEIPSNDPDENPVLLDLNGAELPLPDIDVDPLVVDFGDVDINNSSTLPVTVANLGSATLNVTGVTLAGTSEFSFSTGSLPGSLGVGGSTTVYVTYAPLDEAADTGTLSFDSDDPDEPTVVVSLFGGPTPMPDIDVDPWTIDFGVIKVNESDTAWVTIYNVGDADLDLYSCTRSGDPNFSILTNPAGTLVAPGGSVQMEVGFYPTANLAYGGMIDIASNDPMDPVVTVELMGEADSPLIEIDPDFWDFGNVYYGCDDYVDVAIRSVGSVPLTLNGYSWSTMPGASMSADTTDLDAYINNGWDLDPGDEIIVSIDFIPADINTFDGLLTINNDSANWPIATAAQEGDGAAGGVHQDNWVQVGNNESDVLWVVDNSCSMGDEQGYLADDFGYFYSVLNGAGVDYRIATVTTDNDDFQGSTKVIDPYTPNGAAVFSSNCTVGTGGSGTERGLQYGYSALTQAINNQSPNQGFWRQDAGLRVVYVSDEPDQSGDWGTYLSYYQGLKADPSTVILSAICGTNGFVAQSCSGPGGSASPGSGYVDVANSTGGVLGSICDSDWSTVLTNLAWITVNLADTFTLTYVPITNTIEVYVDGSLQTMGWSWDANLNAVVFSPSYVPQDGAVIQILYDYYGNC